jgi:hypothetical protein
MKYITTPVLFLILFLLASGCNKFVQASPPETQLETAQVFSSDPNATAAMDGLYSQAMTSPGTILNGGISLYTGLSSDELRPIGIFPAPVTDFSTNTLKSANTYNATLYASAYKSIYHANIMITDLGISPGISGPTRNQLIGEAKFIRALLYFYLLNLYGGVPLETTVNYETNAVAPRMDSSKVYQQIINDLKDAQDLLQEKYATGHADPGERTRPNKWAATALLARVYLYRKNWQAAEEQATKVISSGTYRLLPSPDSVFMAASPEAIWQLQPVSTIMSTAEGYYFIPPGLQAKAIYALGIFQEQAFEPGDLRKAYWTRNIIIEGITYYYPFKYRVRSGGYPYTEYNLLLRLAELFLIRSEARAEQDNIDGALADLNIIRHRAGLVNSTAAGQPDILAAIMHERQAELFTEYGHRWLDLKRTGQADKVLGTEKPGWTTYSDLYPIPLADLQRNSALNQNAGY